MDSYLESVKGILQEVKDEVQKLHSKQEEFNNMKQDIHTIKDNTSHILKLMQEGSINIKKNITQEF